MRVQSFAAICNGCSYIYLRPHYSRHRGLGPAAGFYGRPQLYGFQRLYCARIAQGGAALAAAFKTRDAKIKGLALPSALSAFMGITEPAIFGVNLRFFKPFIAGCIGGGCGTLVCALTSLAASGTGVTGIFGILLCLAQPVQYAIMFAVATLVSFAISFVLYKDEPRLPSRPKNF